MTKNEPRFWGSWKGRVIRAIAINDAKTWDEIRDLTGLFPKSLNKALYELFELGILKKTSDGAYEVSAETFTQSIRTFSMKQKNPKILSKHLPKRNFQLISRRK